MPEKVSWVSYFHLANSNRAAIRQYLKQGRRFQRIIFISLALQMENRFGVSNRILAPADSGPQSKNMPSQEMGSPKFARKREGTTFFARKADKKPEVIEPITFISPKKYLDTQTVGTDSYRSITSIRSFGRPADKNLEPSYQAQATKVPISPSPSYSDLQLPAGKTFQRAEDIIARVKSNQDAIEARNKCQNLDKKVSELTERVRHLKEENSYLYQKIEDFNGVISEKNAIINQFSTLLKQKEQSLNHSHSEIECLRRRNEELELSIAQMTRQIEESSKCSLTNISVETDDGEKDRWQQVTETYKLQVEELTDKLKYSQVQASMLQKFRHDLDAQIAKNQQLKNQNKKLILRVEYLCNLDKLHDAKNDRHCARASAMGLHRGRHQLQVSLELSPEK